MPSQPASIPPDEHEQTLADRLRRWARERPHERAFTFVDFPDLASEGQHQSLTWLQLYRRAEVVAAQVGGAARPGDRAALLMPQGLDYVAGFLGCLLAQVVAVPLFPPDLPGHESRIAAVLRDCEPACALVRGADAKSVETYAQHPALALVPLISIGGEQAEGGGGAGNGSGVKAAGNAGRLGARAAAEAPAVPPPGMDEIAYLQYTSGSTRAPAGVMISHRNVLANATQALSAFEDVDSPATLVGWLPLFHDMGLVLSVAAPVVGGLPSVLMDPVAFLEKPERWLRLLSLYPGTMSAAPNFAYDYCASRVGPQQAAGLRLDRVRALINGSEPVRRDTVRRFQMAFGEVGLRPEVQCPSYGLAEATVFVATDGPATPPYEVTCRRDALSEGRIELVVGGVAGSVGAGVAGRAAGAAAGGGANQGNEAAAAVTTLMGCGAPVDQELRIVDPATKAVLPEDVVGEILLRGPNIGLGYWKNVEKSSETFEATLLSTGEQPWLRTGDLGAIHNGQLLVTGRLKDLLIADGRNHYPQDIEETLQGALDYVRRGRVAVFAVPGEEGELVVAIAEHIRDLIPDDALRAEAERTARARIASAHGLRLERLVLVPPDAVARTSSGKISRSACRAAYLRGEHTGTVSPEDGR